MGTNLIQDWDNPPWQNIVCIGIFVSISHVFSLALYFSRVFFVCVFFDSQVIITKCSHSFCRACIRANLDTRLRKCPACGRAFGEGDVKPLYLT